MPRIIIWIAAITTVGAVASCIAYVVVWDRHLKRERYFHELSQWQHRDNKEFLRGEFSRLFTREEWRQYTSTPFVELTDPLESLRSLAEFEKQRLEQTKSIHDEEKQEREREAKLQAQLKAAEAALAALQRELKQKQEKSSLSGQCARQCKMQNRDRKTEMRF